MGSVRGPPGFLPYTVHKSERLTCCCLFSKYVSFRPLLNRTPRFTAQALNRHPAQPHSASSMFPSYRVGVSEDRNKKCRRTMEDSHSFVYDFGGVVGQGYFAVFE
jgi:hypothetical protein